MFIKYHEIMRILIFSDTHLTDRFEPEKCTELKRIISKAEQIIINGDFWDGYLTSFDKFIDSEWKQLFPLLLEKKTIYIYGNHDKREFLDTRCDQFSVKQVDNYVICGKMISFHLQHGHKIFQTLDMRFPRIFSNIFIIKLATIIEMLGYKIIGKIFFKIYQTENNAMKKWAINSLQKNHILICGHSHLAELSLDKQSANSGLIRYGLSQFLIIDNGQIELKNGNY